MVKGDIVRGHFCFNCLSCVDEAHRSKNNPAKTDWCICCGHRAEGLNSTGLVGDWLILGPSNGVANNCFNLTPEEENTDE